MKGVILISGGIDSPVAAKLMKDKEWDFEAIHYSYEPFTDDGPEKKTRKACEKLGIKLKVINVAKDIKQIAEKCKPEYYFILSKRMMMRKAEEEGYDYIITGEAIGQVSSQTIQNLKVIDKAVKIPIIRPLIGMNKEEIINMAKEFGTYEISLGPEVCDVFGNKHPTTRAKLETTEEEEKKLI